MKENIQILVVDDHQVVREGLRRMLEQEADMELVGQGASGEEALLQVEMLAPDIVLMDIKMPGMDGIEVTRRLKEKYPSCNVIMLTFYDEYLSHALEAGARGYLLKDTKREELVQAIRRVHRGGVVVSGNITAKPHNGHDVKNVDKVVADHPQPRQIIPDTMFEEVVLVLPPPVDAGQLMRFASQIEQTLNCRVSQVIGSWQDGTALIIVLTKALSLADMLSKLGGMSGIKAVGEEPLAGETTPKVLKKVTAIPRLSDRLMKAFFVTLETNSTVSVN